MDKPTECDENPTCQWDRKCPGFKTCKEIDYTGFQLKRLKDRVRDWAKEINYNCEWMGDPNLDVVRNMQKYLEKMEE